MSIVSRYILGQFFVASSGVLGGLIATWIAADTLLHIDDVGTAPGPAILGVLLHGLDLLPLGVPIACLTGTVWSLTRAVRFREITAIRCGGIPLRRVLAPLLIASLLVSGGLVFVEDRVVVPARETHLDLDQGGGVGAPRYVEDRWWYYTEASILSARSWDPTAGVLEDVTLFEFDDARHIRRHIDAVSARFDGAEWELEGATVRDFTGSSVEISSASSTRIDLGVSAAELALATPKLEATSLHKLARLLREGTGDQANQAAVETAFHARIAQSLSVLIMVLFAIPFAIGDVERGDSLARALLWSLGVAIVYWITWTVSLVVCRSAVVPPATLLWTVSGVFAVAGLWRFRGIKE